MPSLMDIPGYGVYIQRNAQNRQAEMGDLQQAGTLMGILKQQQATQREAAFRGELQALGPGATQEQLAGVAAKYGSPADVLKTQQSSLDRKAALTERGMQFAENMRLRQDALDAKRDEFNQRTTDAQARAAFEQWYKTESMKNKQQQDALANTLKQQGIDIQAQGLDLRREIQANKPEKPMTEFQGKAALYGTRAAQSDKVLKALEDKVNLPGLAAGQATGIIGNALMSSEQQRVDQAQRDFVNAVLRQESGAVISDAEFANAKRQYFPMTGDSKAALDQKRANRALAIQGFARMSGPKGAEDIKAILDNPLLPGVNPNAVTPQANTAKGAYVETRRTADGRLLGKKADGTIEEIK